MGVSEIPLCSPQLPLHPTKTSLQLGWRLSVTIRVRSMFGRKEVARDYVICTSRPRRFSLPTIPPAQQLPLLVSIVSCEELGWGEQSLIK